MNKTIIKSTLLSFCLSAFLTVGTIAQGSEYTAIYTQENQVGEGEVAPHGGTLMAFDNYRIEMVEAGGSADFYIYNEDLTAVESATELQASIVIFYEDNTEEMIEVKQSEGKFTVSAKESATVKFYAFQVQIGEKYIGARYIVGEE